MRRGDSPVEFEPIKNAINALTVIFIITSAALGVTVYYLYYQSRAYEVKLEKKEDELDNFVEELAKEINKSKNLTKEIQKLLLENTELKTRVKSAERRVNTLNKYIEKLKTEKGK